MKNIIEKLGITPLKQYYNRILDLDIFSTHEIRELEKQRNELLVDHIIDAMSCEESILRDSIFTNDKVKKILEERIDIIEKICSPKSWTEIKELLNE